MMPLPSRLAVPYGYERRDAAVEYAKLELRDAGTWLLPRARTPAVRVAREVRAVRRVGTLAKVARAVGAFFL